MENVGARGTLDATKLPSPRLFVNTFRLFMILHRPTDLWVPGEADPWARAA